MKWISKTGCRTVSTSDDEQQLLDSYLEDWRITSCPPETISEAEQKVRANVRNYVVQARTDKGTALEGLAGEMGFAMAMLNGLVIRRVRHLKYTLEHRIAALEARLDATYHDDGREIAAPRVGFADDIGRRRVTVMPICKPHQVGKVYYAGEIATFSGSTYQALRDTGQSPPQEDWNCLAAAAGSPSIQGTYDPARKNYRMHNMVVAGGASFIARSDSPGPCPGPGWQLMAGQGKQGKPGARGPAGSKVQQVQVNDDGLLTILNSDGSSVTCDLYPLLSKLNR